jgi:hypothetical protein
MVLMLHNHCTLNAHMHSICVMLKYQMMHVICSYNVQHAAVALQGRLLGVVSEGCWFCTRTVDWKVECH